MDGAMKITVQGKPMDLPQPMTAKEIAEKMHLTAPDQAVGVSINGAPKDLSSRVEEGDTVQFWNFDDPQGKEVFWHTSAHVLAQAILRLWPNAQPTIGPPIENGFYYDFGNLTVSDQDFEKIEKEVEAVLAENHKVERLDFANKEEAKGSFGHNPYKQELIESLRGQLVLIAKENFWICAEGPTWRRLEKSRRSKYLRPLVLIGVVIRLKKCSPEYMGFLSQTRRSSKIIYFLLKKLKKEITKF